MCCIITCVVNESALLSLLSLPAAPPQHGAAQRHPGAAAAETMRDRQYRNV
jgi:hypothetical protein